ncbi:hypothetical protein NLI96_g13073 [Meripilus lineatus]|uniref:C2H2-type domain-containing protein n=1 Tax=Meripilus lineatus TaxID=2056292 RepID=A0AAD5UNR6_9APHY|nr:hypothetical protein NLI96_g13073 [Physisporinus lineatus]
MLLLRRVLKLRRLPASLTRFQRGNRDNHKGWSHSNESYTDSSRDSSPTHIFTSSASTSTNSSSTSSPSLSPVPLATAASFDRFAAIARAGPRGHLRSPSRSSSHSSASNSSEFVQGSSSGGRSVSSASSNKRKRVWDDEDDEDYKPKPFQDKPKDKGQQKGKKKGNKKPPKPRTTGHPCLVIGCDHEVRLWGTTRDRNRHMDSHFKLLRFVCPGCETPLCRLDAVRRHARERKKNGDPQCWDAYQGAKITDIEIIPPAWNEAEAWKDMHFPGRDDPLYEDAVKLLGRRG